MVARHCVNVIPTEIKQDYSPNTVAHAVHVNKRTRELEGVMESVNTRAGLRSSPSYNTLFFQMGNNSEREEESYLNIEKQ